MEFVDNPLDDAEQLYRENGDNYPYPIEIDIDIHLVLLLPPLHVHLMRILRNFESLIIVVE